MISKEAARIKKVEYNNGHYTSEGGLRVEIYDKVHRLNLNNGDCSFEFRKI